MNADAAQLDALGKLLQRRAADLSYAGRQLVSQAYGANWVCAKADRYKAAMEARSGETKKLATQMRELGDYLRAKASQLDQVPEDQAPRPGNEEFE